MATNNFYIYQHTKATDGTPFYIGKGSGNRAFVKQRRSDWWNSIFNKHGCDVILLEENLSEDEAFERETYWINEIGRRDLDKGTLVNMTDGGEGGMSGYICSEETKRKMSEAHKGLLKGKKFTEEHKKKLSIVGKRRKPNNVRLVLNLENGIFYQSMTEASKSINMKCSTFSEQLRGVHPNNTNFKII